MKDAKYLQVSAQVRYWEDATVNGKEDADGEAIPCRNQSLWQPIINLESGAIENWPQGTVAEVHYKVCDAGECFLLNADKQKTHKYRDYYVPDELLCPTAEGWGDYIILSINESGVIDGWNAEIHLSEWKALNEEARNA